jgi:endonuclease III related protein
LNSDLTGIYLRLLNYYGPQHWWPADSSFEVMVGAILTQSTAWTNVEKAICNLKAVAALSPEFLRNLSIGELTALIRPSGYYNTKAKKLQALITWLGNNNDDLLALRSKDTQALRYELLSVWGIGEETADSILLYAFDKPVFVIDAYTRRIVNRIGLRPAGDTYLHYQNLFMDNLPVDVSVFNEYHALFVQHGKTTCQKKPVCSKCVLNEDCKFGSSVDCH